MMLAYFPMPYPDEDFRSIIYRYHIRKGNLSFAETNEELFNVRSKRNIYFHHNIGELVHLLNQEKYTIDYFLNNHTIYPLLNPFLTTQRKQEFQQSLGVKNTLKNKKVFLDYISKEIKYCPKCLEDDHRLYGEVYSHRFHQLNFLNFCGIHQMELISVCPECGVPLSNQDGIQLILSPLCKNGHCLTNKVFYHKDYPQPLKRIFQDILYITSHSRTINRNLIVEKFYCELGKRSYGEIYSEYVQLKRLKDDFSKFVSNLKILDIQHFDVINSRFNIILSTKGTYAPNILAYLLLMQFLSNSIEEFFSNTTGYSIDIPFNNKQQPCLNKMCKYYNQLTIKNYPKKYYPIYVQGTFSCPFCGYTYGRKFIWNKDKKSGEVGMPFLITRGEQWENEVLELYYQGLSLKDIATTTGLGTNKDPIVKLLKEKLGKEYEKRFNPKTSFAFYNIHSRLEPDNPKYTNAIKEIQMGMREIAATTYEQQLLLMRRQNIIDILDENPNLKRTEIKRLAIADYEWLKANDQEWFEKNLPKRTK